MALARYNPKAKPAARVVTRDDKTYRNTDGPGGSTIDYGPAKGPSQQERWDADVAEWGMSPWFGRGGAQMPWSGPDGQQRGQRTPFFTPDAGDPRNAGYWRNEQTPEQQAAWQAQQDAQNAAQRAAFAADPAMSAARGAGDLRGYIAARQALQQQGQQQRFMDQGGTAETWNSRFDSAWPVPASRDGTYQYGPGRPGPTPPGVAVPPSQNSMFEGYQPGQSKSGMGGGVNYPAVSTGAGATGMMPMDMMQRLGSAVGGGGSPASLSPDILRKLSQGMPPHLLGLPAGGVAATTRDLPGGVNPVNPGPIGGRPIGGPAPTTPMPPGVGGGANDYLSALMMNSMMSPAMSGFAGQNRFMMDPGMMMFGYRPY